MEFEQTLGWLRFAFIIGALGMMLLPVKDANLVMNASIGLLVAATLVVYLVVTKDIEKKSGVYLLAKWKEFKQEFDGQIKTVYKELNKLNKRKTDVDVTKIQNSAQRISEIADTMSIHVIDIKKTTFGMVLPLVLSALLSFFDAITGHIFVFDQSDMISLLKVSSLFILLGVYFLLKLLFIWRTIAGIKD